MKRKNILNILLIPRRMLMKKSLKLLMSSALIATTLSMPQKVLGMEDIDEVDHHNIKRIVQQHLSKNPDLLDSSKDKDIVVFLGNTGAGKSTLINYLSEKQLEVNVFRKIQLANPNDPSAMGIGLGGGSETFLPKFIQVGQLLLYDLPGFRDNRGTAKNLTNAAFIKRIIENAKSAKLVFVVGIDQITADRGKSFKDLSRTVKQLIPNRHIEQFSSLIVTKSDLPKDVLPGFITTSLSPEINQDPDLSILKSWINNGNINQMSKPTSPLIDPNERIDIINNTVSIMGSEKIQNVDIGVIYDTSQQLEIKRIYDAEIEDVIERLLSQNFQVQQFQVQGLSSLDKRTLENKKVYMMSSFKQLVRSSLDQSSLIELLRPISENLYQASWREKKKTLAILINQIVAQIDAEIHEKQRQEEEARRIQAEKVAEDLQRLIDEERKSDQNHDQDQQRLANMKRRYDDPNDHSVTGCWNIYGTHDSSVLHSWRASSNHIYKGSTYSDGWVCDVCQWQLPREWHSGPWSGPDRSKKDDCTVM